MIFPRTTLPQDIEVIEWSIGDAALDFPNGLAAAIGNFDGVHLGHQHLINAAVADGKTPAVITFSPHPKRFFNPDAEGFSLSDDHDKSAFIAALGVKVILRLTFNDAMRKTSAEDFITKVLPALGVQSLYAGQDFGFGNNRSGGMDLIATLGKNFGITTHAISLIENNDDVISSTRIRGLIASGNMMAAASLLGRPYTVSGTIIKGDQRGRTIGFPTANIKWADMTKPAFGVYSVAVCLMDQPDAPVFGGVANIGIRPTAVDRGVLLETHIFDYDGDLYGERVNIFLLDHIRPERAFENFDALKNQIALDAETARQFLRNHTAQIPGQISGQISGLI